jgi:hypothetical protein
VSGNDDVTVLILSLSFVGTIPMAIACPQYGQSGSTMSRKSTPAAERESASCRRWISPEEASVMANVPGGTWPPQDSPAAWIAWATWTPWGMSARTMT